jgi:transposase
MKAHKAIFQLKNLYNFEGFKFYESWLEEESIAIELTRTKKTGNCPVCHIRCNNIKDKSQRRIRDLDLAGSKAYICFEEYRVSCSCGYTGVEDLKFVNKHSRYSKRFEQKVAILCKVMTLKDVAKEMKMDWSAVKRIDREEAKKYFVDLKYVSPTRIGVDELAYEKGHKYLTIVRDTEKEKVVWIGKGRKEETLNSFFILLGERKCRKIELAVIDMWDPYITSILKYTKADIVFDKFHIAKKVNEAVDKVRKKEFAKADKEERILMKHKRFLILSRQKRLKDEARETLYDLLDVNKELYCAYLLKEQILDILDEKNPETAIKRLKRWFENVAQTGIEQFESVVKTIKNYIYGVHNYFKYKVTNAASEGFNNKIGVMKRRAYGFRDIEYFMLKIYQLCGLKSSR